MPYVILVRVVSSTKYWTVYHGNKRNEQKKNLCFLIIGFFTFYLTQGYHVPVVIIGLVISCAWAGDRIQEVPRHFGFHVQSLIHNMILKIWPELIN
jgi:hypothetical protein